MLSLLRAGAKSALVPARPATPALMPKLGAARPAPPSHARPTPPAPVRLDGVGPTLIFARLHAAPA
jgi:hypothetical protein